MAGAEGGGDGSVWRFGAAHALRMQAIATHPPRLGIFNVYTRLGNPNTCFPHSCTLTVLACLRTIEMTQNSQRPTRSQGFSYGGFMARNGRAACGGGGTARGAVALHAGEEVLLVEPEVLHAEAEALSAGEEVLRSGAEDPWSASRGKPTLVRPVQYPRCLSSMTSACTRLGHPLFIIPPAILASL